MRWEALFADLEAQLAAADPDAAMDAERARAELAATALLDRLRGAVGVVLRVRLRDGSDVHGRLTAAGQGWALLAAGAEEVLVALPAVTALRGLPTALAAPSSALEARLGLGAVLRRLVRDRAAVRLRLDGAVLTGTLDRVGLDHLDLAEHPLDEPRRTAAVRDLVTAPLSAVLSVARSASER